MLVFQADRVLGVLTLGHFRPSHALGSAGLVFLQVQIGLRRCAALSQAITALVTAFDASIGNAERGPDEWRCKVRRPRRAYRTYKTVGVGSRRRSRAECTGGRAPDQ